MLALQALLWGGGQILEAKPAAAALMAVAHVEETGSKGCTPLHQHVDCLVCRTFQAGATSGTAPDLPLLDEGLPSRPGTTLTVGLARAPAGGVGSRAPPFATPFPGIA